ncbi:Helix-turn-helix domain-containing protein [Pelosinus fermentans]|uniref:helix-turn-helix domain-containing protein n=1 Tax=Pelosinus fermentans TaxID=365349 RepID=UPI0002685F9B|nr:AraC family transcriptional regulator [Pelosinus fermentans]OAM92274.1 transcriptional regulator with integral membrane sensor, AraC family [Pelosinus fermentans DSM 17108]SDQ39219.1 Helix-turn-helix domain-containing protein [Pelosinus fermentans]
MSVQEHIRQIDTKFFLCTHLPIRTFDFNGNLIYSAGYNREMEDFFEHHDIFEQVRQELVTKTENCIITIPCLESISFTACWVCSKNINWGFHILGPYTTLETVNLSDIVYKPAYCIPYLITLLGTIAADSAYLKQKIKKFNDMPYSAYVKKSIDYLNARYHETITLSDIAAHLNISKYYLCSLFKKETGKNFSQYLNEIRIEKSKELLLKENVSVLDIALSVGFNNQNYYNVMFKKFMKYTPLEFRNQCKSS